MDRSKRYYRSIYLITQLYKSEILKKKNDKFEVLIKNHKENFSLELKKFKKNERNKKQEWK